MRYDTMQDYQSPSRYDGEPVATEPSDLDVAAPADEAAALAPADGKTLWPEDAVRDFQQRWREVQMRFVDDPQAAADDAGSLVTEALDRFSDVVATRKGELDGWRGADGADTERMRMVVRHYHDLLDRILDV
jgi:hypothetical protein